MVSAERAEMRRGFSKEVRLDLRPKGNVHKIWVGREKMKACTLPRKQHDSNPEDRNKSVWRTEKYGLFDQLMFIEPMLCARHRSRY